MLDGLIAGLIWVGFLGVAILRSPKSIIVTASQPSNMVRSHSWAVGVSLISHAALSSVAQLSLGLGTLRPLSQHGGKFSTACRAVWIRFCNARCHRV